MSFESSLILFETVSAAGAPCVLLEIRFATIWAFLVGVCPNFSTRATPRFLPAHLFYVVFSSSIKLVVSLCFQTRSYMIFLKRELTL